MPRTRGGEAKIRRHSRRIRCTLVAVAALLALPSAFAADPVVPWAGGDAVETPLERYGAELASIVAGRPVRVICTGSAAWAQLAVRQGFDPVAVWGFVVFANDPAAEAARPPDEMHLSEAACWYLDAYWRAPAAEKGKRCRLSTRITFQERTIRVGERRRVKIAGRWTIRWVYVTRTVQVPVSVPRFGTCPDYRDRVFALQTISHESQHLRGIRDEATAECDGMQRLPWFAERFGATEEQARQMAGDYFRDVYEVERPGTPYFLPACSNPAGG